MVRALRRLCRLPDALESDRGYGDEICHDQNIAHCIFAELATRQGRLALASGRGSNRRIAALFLRDWVRWQILKEHSPNSSRARPAESLLMTSRQTIQCQDSDRVALTCWPVIEDHV
ncbi:hypothetical protein AB0883_29790 [Micromonospora sp. NPDC047812]|uniref:hypothetical protein n=1 Tax=Micromonospora sp. NPDC047812 TaxID=3155742 RepID=UPI0034528D06